MLIFNTGNKHCVFIHIPKNGGKLIRKKIVKDKNNNILKNYWGINVATRFDFAHVPYVKKNEFVENDIEYGYFAYTRNPYDRIISAFLYKNPKANTEKDFKYFVKNTLTMYDFNMSFDYKIIHYYPQYLFVCDENLDIPKCIEINKLDNTGEQTKYDLMKYFDDDCINIVNTIYCKDFLFFNYPKLVNENNGV